MPSYFYHLKFELYPFFQPSTHAGQRERDFWVPPPGADIFAPNWPAHKLVDREDGGTAKAVRDWRFGRVRVEAWNMPPTPPPSTSTERKEETSGMGSGLVEAGRVTKAEFRALEGKNTEIGWGVVHLYRDGEESAGLWSVGGEEVYDGEEDCTTLCIPAVPSYLTPSDFLGFVGEKTRGVVSHFRMVMTGRMNRYLVLMKFRDGGVAKRWRAEWDGKVFNSMEVSYGFLDAQLAVDILTVDSRRRVMLCLSSP